MSNMILAAVAALSLAWAIMAAARTNRGMAEGARARQTQRTGSYSR